MKQLLIIFALLNLNYIYSQDRFSSNQFLYNSGLTYSPNSYEKMLGIALEYRRRADENYEKLRKLRNELNTIKQGIKLNPEKYHSSIDEVNDILYRLLTNDNTNFAHPDTAKIIKTVSLFIDDTINDYNEDIRIYNDRKKYNY